MQLLKPSGKGILPSTLRIATSCSSQQRSALIAIDLLPVLIINTILSSILGGISWTDDVDRILLKCK